MRAAKYLVLFGLAVASLLAGLGIGYIVIGFTA